MTNSPTIFEEVVLRVEFASRRIEDLKQILSRQSPTNRFGERLQVMQEFFFHLLGAREVLAMLIIQKRGLKHDPEMISMGHVIRSLASNDPAYSTVRELVVDPRKEPFPSDPYSEGGYIYRAILYRNQVAHRHRAPVHIEQNFPERSKLYLYIDPRNYDAGHSNFDALHELEVMRDIFRERYAMVGKAL